MWADEDTLIRPPLSSSPVVGDGPRGLRVIRKHAMYPGVTGNPIQCGLGAGEAPGLAAPSCLGLLLGLLF